MWITILIMVGIKSHAMTCSIDPLEHVYADHKPKHDTEKFIMNSHGTCIGDHKPKCNNKILKRTEFSVNFEEDAYVDHKTIFSMASVAWTLQILDFFDETDI